MAYTAQTDTSGVNGELLYVKDGRDINDYANASGKIVVVNLSAPGLIYDDVFKPFQVYSYDPDNTLAGAKVTQNWPIVNFRRPEFKPYTYAKLKGAIGIIAIVDFDLADTHNYFTPYDHVVRFLPGVYVSKHQGNKLKDMLATGTVTASIKVKASINKAITQNVIATIPGKSDEVILVTTHYDGWATNDASGTAVMLALANYFAESSLERSLVFLWAGGHFAGDKPTKDFIQYNPDLINSVIALIGIEHIGKELVEEDGQFRDTGFVSPRLFYLSGSESPEANPVLSDITMNAIKKQNIKRTIGIPAKSPNWKGPPGLSHWYFAHGGIPIAHLISGPAIMFTPMDTPDTVAKDQLMPVTKALIEIIEAIDVVDAELLK